MIRLQCILFVLMIGMPSLGHAEFFRYQNENGVTVFTDDLSRVPVDQRPKVTQYEDVTTNKKSYSNADFSEAKQNVTPTYLTMAKDFGSADASLPDKSKSLNQRETMNQRKTELEEEYKALIKEKEVLENTNAEFESDEELKAYNEKIINLNQRISNYDILRKAFSAEVEIFNSQQDNAENVN